MKHLIITFAMNATITLPLLAQETSNWMAAAEQTLGPRVSSSWILDLATEDVEIHVSPEKALVLVDREPIITTENGEAFLKAGIFGLAGTRLTIQSDVEFINDSLLHGCYAGTLEGHPVVMDQYLRIRNDVPVQLVRVVRSVQGSAPVPAYQNVTYVRSLLEVVAVAPDPAMAMD